MGVTKFGLVTTKVMTNEILDSWNSTKINKTHTGTIIVIMKLEY